MSQANLSNQRGAFQDVEKVFKPLGVTRSIIRKGHPEDDAFVERSHQTDDQEFYIPYLLMIKNEKDLIKRAQWWQSIYNLERPHQGLENLTPYEKLKSLGYSTGEEICLFPTLILDSVCCLDPFKIKTKSVQYHLDYNLSQGQFFPSLCSYVVYRIWYIAKNSKTHNTIRFAHPSFSIYDILYPIYD